MPSLHWIGKEKVVNHHLDIPYHTLDHTYTFVPDDGTQPDAPNPESENKIIHADNLLALKSLLPEYEGRIKCIYIDPPYNTGNEEWKYNDNVSDPKFLKWLNKVVGKEGEDLTRHDKWLCMMYPRLKLLHKLLAEDGAIFISIDDNEQANLKLMIDEIFGKKCFVSQLIWKSRRSEDARAKTGVSNDHEYVFCYSKNPSIKFFGVQKDLTKFSNIDADERGPWRSADLTGLATKEQRPNLHYELIDSSTKQSYQPPIKGWRFDMKTMAKKISEDRILFPKNPTGRPRQKMFLNEMISATKTLSSVIVDYNTGDGTKEINSLLGGGTFDFPKPTGFIQFLIDQVSDSDSIILDSFAGSGTTAHAVLNLNKQDGGNRKFILIEMENYADTITAERVKRVITGYKDTEGTGGSFSYYTLGERVLDDDNNLNPNLPLQKIHQYIWFAEVHQPYTQQATAAGYLGKCNNTGIYFNYQPHQITILDNAYLVHVTVPCEQYIMYADVCLLSEKTLLKHNIIFKKIPRDISRL